MNSEMMEVFEIFPSKKQYVLLAFWFCEKNNNIFLTMVGEEKEMRPIFPRGSSGLKIVTDQEPTQGQEINKLITFTPKNTEHGK